ncbi:3-keto-steroid reductase/17-beta-hydroxysteroid dehydrogenase 7-like isoform X2 [Apostichopus japonicus]|uniref:3-keto-steroid reductase/17-beta-hydroxysteroid dehydrogenase 7-like isoform X2 n=1 Tax=Stichopus japonicus TaxID=307972 RepID=UPI003AB3AD44
MFDFDLSCGVGFAIAQRLLTLEITLTICLACRNVSKAEKAKSQLTADHPEASIDILQLDTSSISSVSEAAKELQQRYSAIDYMYLNAGIMPQTSINWRYLFWCLLHPVYLFDAISTGEGLLQMVDSETKDGLKLIFATNLFGHFLLIRKLEDFLISSGGCHIIWTSSSNARRKHFDMDDFQHQCGNQGYSSSKFGINLISNAIDQKLRDHCVYSHVTCPGFSITGMTSPMLQTGLWTLLYPFFVLLRLIAPIMCITPWNSAEAPVWLFHSDPKDVSPALLHTSHISILGNGYVNSKKIDFSSNEPELLYEHLSALQAELEGQ